MCKWLLFCFTTSSFQVIPIVILLSFQYGKKDREVNYYIILSFRWEMGCCEMNFI